MDRLKTLLVAIDFSPCSAAALKQAVRIAALNRAKVTALHIVEMPVYVIPDGVLMPFELPPVDTLLATARERWANWPAAMEEGANVVFEAVLGFARTELLERFQRDCTDLLVIGAHGELDGKRRVGSIAAACVQRAATKVLVVRENQTSPYQSVVACIDFSQTSLIALEQAIRIAAQDNAALHILHVYSDPWLGIGPPTAVATRMPEIAAKYHEALRQHLQRFCEPLAHEIGALKGSFHVMHFDAGGHGKGIVEFVTRERCDLVVLGTRSKWNLRDMIWGSTAERVVREAPSAVLTVKPPEIERESGGQPGSKN